MNNLTDISNFIDAVPLGQPIYKITQGYGDEVSLRMTDWQEKNDLRRSNNWLESEIALNLSRKYSINLNRMILVDREAIINNVKIAIADEVAKIIMKVSPADQPKRTNVFKELCEISYMNRRNDNFINDLIPIVNYYKAQVESTDSINKQVHRKNVFGLLDILRKKYAKSSN